MSSAVPPANPSDSPRRTCRVCRSEKGHFFEANGFSWRRCTNCACIQKTLSFDQYLKLQPSYDPGHYLDSKNKAEIEAYLNVGQARQLLSRVIDRHLIREARESAAPLFLDVGCGMGAYLLAAQQLGFEVLGFEPSENHARVALEHFGLPVIRDYFLPESVGGKKFDFIMLSHVLEHIYDPAQFTHSLLSVLKPGGILLVITPNSAGIVSAFTRKHWPMLKPIDHVTLISKDAYQYFNLSAVADVHHSTSEYFYEFAATVLSSIKSMVREPAAASANGVSSQPQTAAPPLRRKGMKTTFLQMALSVASLPPHLLAAATDRRACLNTVVVRKA